MDEQYIGTIHLFAGNFAPRNFAFCDGQLLNIAQHTALFSLIGTTYGGDGRTTFALPDLRGRYPMHKGTGPGLTPRVLGERGGQEGVILTTIEMPSHAHAGSGAINAKEEGDTDDPNGNYVAGTGNNTFGTTADVTMHAGCVHVNIEYNGGNQPHNNMSPYLGINYIICLQGIYPSRS